MIGDIIAEHGTLFLGTRLKRLTDRMQADAVHVLEQSGWPVQPAHGPLLAALEKHGTLTVSQCVEALGISQPGVTRSVGALVELGFIAVSRPAEDARQKVLSLTPAGATLVARLRHEFWPQVRRAADELCAGLEGALLDQVAGLEAKLADRSLAKRIFAQLDVAPDRPIGMSDLILREFDDGLVDDFAALNAEWIEAMFTLEANDLAILHDPRGKIVEHGGIILFAEAPDLGIVGTGALMKIEEGVFELTKMAVTPRARGRGAGEFLLRALLERAQAMEIDDLYLLTHPDCAAAIKLYEKVGFVHDPALLRTRGGRYVRATVAMRWPTQAPNAVIDPIVRPARGAADMAAVAGLFTRYAEELGVDLTVQNFAAEVAGLPGAYAAPAGELFLAVGPAGNPVGCLGLRPFRAGQVCELKRLFVDPSARGSGLGRRLIEAACERAKAIGYATMVLDTLPTLGAALALYADLGFERTAPYWNNPVPDVVYFGKDIADMVFPAAELVARISRDMPLVPGDIISCGTSVGVGSMKGPTNEVEVEIDGIGTLRNRYVG